MNYSSELHDIARSLVAPGKGILAADESNGTMNKRLDSVGVATTEDNRRDYREMLFRTPGASDHISGVILYDETIRQNAADGSPMIDVIQKAGLVPGIKVDTGARELAGAPGEKVTEGLDGLRERLQEYHKIGARFAKWRAVIDLQADLPTDYCLDVNAHALARYAALCTENGIVPIVEPEVLMDGAHDIEQCYDVTFRALRKVFGALLDQRVVLENILLKPNMVVSGKKCADQADVATVAGRTLDCFRSVVPAAVPGIVFLSGGQSDEKATAHLNAMNNMGPLPWELSFSYGRALIATALKTWSGKTDQVEAAQKAFHQRARLNGLARDGKYNESMEQAA